MPLEFVHPGTERKAVRIETPQNPSSERNQRISRKLLLGTPLGANPQLSTSTGGENVKTIPAKGAPKTGQRSHGCGHGAPSARGHGAPPTGTPTYLLGGLEVYTVSVMDMEERVRGVNRGHL